MQKWSSRRQWYFGLVWTASDGTESVLTIDAELSQLALDKNILVIVPSLNAGAPNRSTSFLNLILQEAQEKYNFDKNKVILGGLSGGGMAALRYSEASFKDKSQTYLTPCAVYGVDPPVDLAILYSQANRDIVRNFSDVAVKEGKWLVEGMKKSYGGTPETAIDNYIANSLYSYSESDGGNAKYLLEIPVRIYCDPDIEWQMKNKHRDYFDLNAPSLSAMINLLNMKGNTRAEFISALGRGKRLDGLRHPHSWTLIEPKPFINWMMTSFVSRKNSKD